MEAAAADQMKGEIMELNNEIEAGELNKKQRNFSY